MLCPTCHGRHVINSAAGCRPCPECGGMGEVHCCDGLAAQPDEERFAEPTEEARTARACASC
jgi:hypothetical protein